MIRFILPLKNKIQADSYEITGKKIFQKKDKQQTSLPVEWGKLIFVASCCSSIKNTVCCCCKIQDKYDLSADPVWDKYFHLAIPYLTHKVHAPSETTHATKILLHAAFK